jgi:hypothetical protein
MKKQEKKVLVAKDTKNSSIHENDGTNRPIPSANEVPISESEAALFKQAENPLGDPHKA